MTTLLAIAAAALVAALAGGRRALLAWYIWEVQRQPVAETPDEAILTYPLA